MNYDLEYFERMLRLNSKTAEEICRIRWGWIEEVQPKVVLDWGSGCGFFRAWRPEGIEVYSYDIGPYPQTGIPLKIFDLLCCYDVLEHLPDFSGLEPILALSRHVVVSIPVKPENVPLIEWKHLKIGEHLHIWTDETINIFFKKYGFKLLKNGQPECPPRQHITSFLYKKDHLI
jgi:hypothetical protein